MSPEAADPRVPAGPPHPQQREAGPGTSTAAQALAAAGDVRSAQDVGALDDAALAAKAKLGSHGRSLVERLIYGPAPSPAEFRAGAATAGAAARSQGLMATALDCLQRGEAFTADRKLSSALRERLARERAYGFTVPADFGGMQGTYPELAIFEEELAANGLGALAVEISGELTIGAGSLQAYGTPGQKRLFLPLIAEGRLMGFGLTEVRVGVNAKKIQAYVEWDESGSCWRLFAEGDRRKLYITNATHGALVGIVARVGKASPKVGLFIVQLPDADVTAGVDYEFRCEPSGVEAFASNHNSRLTFRNFPIPRDHQIQADGVEVLFYCLRMGRCMLAAMAAGYQRMFAADAAHYALRRDGVGGPVIKHELPRLNLGRMLGGALQSRALSHLSLAQDAAGVDLAGLRDLTKSAAASTSLESLIACERVLGGRSFDQHSRVSEARSNIHVFGVVEGEDDLILMGMVKDITGPFVEEYLAGLLGVLDSINQDAAGKPLPAPERILRITPLTALREPARVLRATGRILRRGSFWRLVGWAAKGVVDEIVRLPAALLPATWNSRYSDLPRVLRRYAKFAERALRRQRWVFLIVNGFYQLELTRAQLPLQRFGKRIEHLVSILAVCHHAADGDASQVHIAALQAQVLSDKARAIRLVRGLRSLEALRRHIAAVGRDLEAGECSLVSGVAPQPFAHPWSDDNQKKENPR
ncbi:MAG: acyl-CoA dehydrogenase family protein [Planctomycetota bacterium]